MLVARQQREEIELQLEFMSSIKNKKSPEQ
jgi:hypothetical protein